MHLLQSADLLEVLRIEMYHMYCSDILMLLNLEVFRSLLLGCVQVLVRPGPITAILVLQYRYNLENPLT